MRLGKHTNGISCEYEMQDKFKEFIDGLNERFKTFRYNKIRPIECFSEFYVKAVSRRADFLIISEGRLINVEAKCNDFSTMMRQLDDHAKYCNYCFAYIPDYSLTPEWFKKRLLSRGYGLIVYNHKHKIVTEVLEAHQNKSTDSILRRAVIHSLRETEKQKQRELKIEQLKNSQQHLKFEV